MRGSLAAVGIVCFIALCAAAVPGALGADLAGSPLVEWTFDTEGDFRGWSASGHIGGAAVTAGALVGEAIDWDPILLGPAFELAATPTQCVEIKMRATHAGNVQLFWTDTLEGKYGGFSEKKVSRFATRADGTFHVYRIHPFWHAAKKIVRFRLDPTGEGRFEIAWIRVVDAPRAARPAAEGKRPPTAWTFADNTHGFTAWREVSKPVVRGGCLHATAEGLSPILMSGLLSVVAKENPYVSVRMAVDRGTTGRIYCVSSSQIGWDNQVFPLLADGKMHSYNIDVAHLAHWRDEILMLGIQPTDVEGATATIESIAIGNQPRGPAELQIDYFGRAEGVNRVGRPAEVILSLRNRGGEKAQNVAATLTAPEGVRIVGPPVQNVPTLTRYLPKTASWKVEASAPGEVELAVEVNAPGLESMVGRAKLPFTPTPEIPEGDYIPRPEPVASNYDVGVFYFPGWHSRARWQPILDFPLRKPVLGWYDESLPECADWQIKWAVEHGVNFFMVDWYWCEGNRHLEHWLHNAYEKARFRKHLKWAVMWANHNRPDTHSVDDWRRVTQYWIDHYFGMDEYYRIDGRPAVFIWAPGNIRRDVGGSEQAAKLYAMSQVMAKEAGYSGIYFAAMSSHESPGKCRELKSEGYEAFTSYHGFQLASQRAGSRRFPFADVTETGPEVWRAADQRASGLLYMPIVDSGWSSEPWHRGKALSITGRTPELFGALCRKAAEYADTTGKRIIAVGPCNEWGEGSYIEPYAEHGFGDLDALRAAFCPPGAYPPNLIPADLGRGPYDLPKLEPKTAWHFNTDGDLEGWSPNGQMEVEVRDGRLAGRTTSSDPILAGPGVQIEAASTRTLLVGMKSDTDIRVQIFWGTTMFAPSEASSVRFEVPGDGQLHTLQLDLGQSPAWRGLVTSLRFDPASKPGASFAIDRIEFR